MQFFLNYSWPGNVRELQNLIESIVVIKGTGMATIDDLPSRMFLSPNNENPGEVESEFPEKGIDLNRTVEDFEKELLRKALEKSFGVKSHAAKLLGINRTTLVEKLKRYGIANDI